MPKSIVITSGNRVHWSSGDILGKCGDCEADAAHYNEDGNLRCTDCLMEEEAMRCEDCEGLPHDCECGRF